MTKEELIDALTEIAPGCYWLFRRLSEDVLQGLYECYTNYGSKEDL